LLYGVEKQAKQEAEKTLKSQCAHDAPSDNETDDCDDKMHDRDDEMHDRRCACDAPSDDETHDRRSHQLLVEKRLHELLVENRLRLRKDSATLRLADFRAWLQSQQAERGGAVLPKSPLGQAIQYALNQWAALCVYATDGRLAIDNNAAENALRRVAIGRKNWLFAGSDNGGRTAATLLSLIATCQRHQVEPMAYLRDVLARIAAIPINQLATLLPDRWQPMTGN
jgi:hypothetical protein